MELLTILLYILFVIAAIVLIVVVLLQEGKGGGFGEALGAHGRETFGVGAKGINTFTGVVAVIFVASALLIHILNRNQAGSSLVDSPAGSSVIDTQAPPAGNAPIPTAPSTPPAGEQKQ